MTKKYRASVMLSVIVEFDVLSEDFGRAGDIAEKVAKKFRIRADCDDVDDVDVLEDHGNVVFGKTEIYEKR